jgi:hypothetical protein
MKLKIVDKMSLEITKIHNKASRTTTETIEFNVLDNTNLKYYAITDNTYDENNEISNIHQHFYKFPNQPVKKGDKVILHTGKGTNGARRKLVGAFNDVFDFYCNSNNFMWNDTGDMAKLYKLDLIDKEVVPRASLIPRR